MKNNVILTVVVDSQLPNKVGMFGLTLSEMEVCWNFIYATTHKVNTVEFGELF